MATGETFKCSVIGELDDLTAVVFDFGYVQLGGSANDHIDTGTGAGAFQTLVEATMAAALPDDFNFVKYRFACVGGAHLGEIGHSFPANPLEGDLVSANRSPNELCASLKRSTGYASRRDRGRVFFGPLSTAVHDNGNVNKVDVAGPLLAVANKLKSNLAVAGITLSPVILAADGTYSGRIVINTSVAAVMVHRRTRRPRTGA